MFLESEKYSCFIADQTFCLETDYKNSIASKNMCWRCKYDWIVKTDITQISITSKKNVDDAKTVDTTTWYSDAKVNIELAE